jgi:hypothetical protein
VMYKNKNHIINRDCGARSPRFDVGGL